MFFTEDYYAYNSGELKSVEALTSHDTVGFNQWDDTKDGAVNGYYRFFDIPIGADHQLHITFRDKDTSVNISDISVGFVRDINDVNSAFIWVLENGTPAIYDSNVIDSGVYAGNYCGHLMVYPNTIDAYNRLKQRYDICVNISGSRNGEYEPYQKHSYALDSDLTLRGIPKLDASNNLYYDGDEYAYDGTVTRKYGIVDLGTLNWNYNSTWNAFASTSITDSKARVDGAFCICERYVQSEAHSASDSVVDKTINLNSGAHNVNMLTVRDSSYTDAAAFKTAMSGVYLVYELATPTTEPADPYQQVQICDGDGTEEFVSTSIVPVGTESRYNIDLVGKLEDMPTIPSAPTTDGTYSLQLVVSDGEATAIWT